MSSDTLKHVDTMIGADAVIQGDLMLKGGVIIYGKVFGNVITDGPVRIARKAIVKGNVVASDAFIGGAVEGNLTTNGKVVLRCNSSLTGDLVYRRLIIEDGAHFEGKCDLLTDLSGQKSIARDHQQSTNVQQSILGEGYAGSGSENI